MEIEFLEIMEIIGVIAFSVSGAHVAMEKRMDIFGTFVLALITASGGGVMRDVIMNVGLPRFFSSFFVIGAGFFGACLTMFIYRLPAFAKSKNRMHWTKIVLILDAVGLAAFGVDGAFKGINGGYNLWTIIFIATISSVGGGVLRDVLSQRIPVVLRREIYASAVVAGAVFIWGAHQLWGDSIAKIGGIIIIIGIRIISVWRNYHLPVVELGHMKSEPENVQSEAKANS